MGTLHGIELCSACAAHEAQYKGKCKWCYENDRNALRKGKQQSAAKQHDLADIDHATRRMQLRTIEKGLKE